MKIGFDAKRAFHNSRGLGSYSRNLIYGLNKYHPDFRLNLYTPQFKEQAKQRYEFLFNSSNAIITPSFPQSLLPSLWRRKSITKLLENDQVDIYHGLSHELPLGIEKWKGKKIVTIHDLQYLKFPQFFSTIDRTTYAKKVEHACRVADQVIAICKHTKQDLMDNLNIEASKIAVHYQSCAESFFPENQNLTSTRPNSNPYILHVGAFVPNKNQITLIEAFYKISRDYPHDLILIGSGKDKTYYEDMLGVIEQLKIKERVKIISDVSNDHLVEYYKGADVFCFPSIYEGFGIPVIEAMFCGTPVITSNSSSLPEVGGVAAEYVDPFNSEEIAERMINVLSNEVKATKMREMGLQHVQQFHLEKTTQNLVNIYKN